MCRRWVLPSLLLFAASELAAESVSAIYKCRAADGSLAYRDTPCSGDDNTELVELHGSGAVKRARALEGPCLALAKELWRLNGTVNLTELGAEARGRLTETRSRLNNQCRVDLDRTELSQRCAQMEHRVNVESRRDVQALGRLGREFELACAPATVEEDIRRHVKDISTAKTFAD
jgi:hypothetical protein